jgi:hypothetical protein
MAACDDSGSDTGGVAVVDNAQLLEGVDAGLEVDAVRGAGGPDRARAEAGARAVGDELVHGGTDDGDVDAVEVGQVLGVGQAGEREQPGVVGLSVRVA